MKETEIDYPALIDTAMREVVKATLSLVEETGTPGNHHFYVSFRTDYPGAELSAALRARYPEEMTIVLQHQFWDLKVKDTLFTVSLSFNNVPEKLVIPFDAVTAFADPSVKFGLQFHVEPGVHATPPAANTEPEAKTPAKPVKGEGNIITLDSFRKKES